MFWKKLSRLCVFFLYFFILFPFFLNEILVCTVTFIVSLYEIKGLGYAIFIENKQ